jgi:hypothetical protein
MKEIKFRYWNRDTMQYDFGGWCEDISINEIFAFFKKEKILVMQYIGLKDMNDKEIYEGDILQWERAYRDIKWVVNWDDMFVHSNWHSTGMRYEIIGNKFENPELLNEQ